jgi:hypothetical protein
MKTMTPSFPKEVQGVTVNVSKQSREMFQEEVAGS